MATHTVIIAVATSLTAVATGIYAVLQIIYRPRKVKLRIRAGAARSKFSRIAKAGETTTPVTTFICFEFRICNEGNRMAIIDSYRVKIKSPRLNRSLLPLTQGDFKGLHYQSHDGITITSAGPASSYDGVCIQSSTIHINPTPEWVDARLTFDIDTVLPKDKKDLECRLTLYHHDKRRTTHKFQVIKKGL